MNMNVHEAGRENGIAKVHHPSPRRNFTRGSRTPLDNHVIIHQKQRLIHSLERCVKTICGKGDHLLKRLSCGFGADGTKYQNQSTIQITSVIRHFRGQQWVFNSGAVISRYTEGNSRNMEYRMLIADILRPVRQRELSSTAHTQEFVGEWLSLVEHLVRDQGVGGSNPLSPTNIFKHITDASGFPSTSL